MRYVGEDERGSLRRHPHRLKHNLKSLLSSHYSVNSRLPQLLPSCGPLSLSCCAVTQSAKPLHPSCIAPRFSLSSISYLSCLISLYPSCSAHLPPRYLPLPLSLSFSTDQRVGWSHVGYETSLQQSATEEKGAIVFTIQWLTQPICVV